MLCSATARNFSDRVNLLKILSFACPSFTLSSAHPTFPPLAAQLASACSPLLSKKPNNNRSSQSLISCSDSSLKAFFSPLRSVTTMASGSEKDQTSVHDFTVKDVKGNDVDLSIYKGKVLLIVNVASQCGLTNSNYKELNELYEKYKDQGLEILAFPCNQFGGQEPGSNEEIIEVACTRFKAEFPIFDKVEVNGKNTAPVYKFLKSSKRGILGEGIKWNFSKFLVDKEGHVVDRYAPTTSPLSIEKDIKKLLAIV
ncbi:probable phospholipid hydroperoxide glutathione peroxidase isoform X2 [Amborella trichopoda]|uniref:probable phospholipid hydroperoxide glutathione peroxidase isoform X2 n=1 Tax=Amborella trichopoda TaxID=13333 RepID=UPI0009BDC9A7|nr:probable phospholipid hydroperoxide glutathione peroxidase isoform X2 [Amborella trichopoda]|eukprot:XP_020526541.1 probable phospholipid hydroperoxide glutathione peroxidase isoform X2 [Amborella trichopoda]